MNSSESAIKTSVQRVGDGDMPAVTVIVRPRTLELISVLPQELSDINSFSHETEVYLALSGMTAGGFCTSLAVLTTTSIDSPYKLAGWVCGFIVSVLATICFAFLARISRRKLTRRLEWIAEKGLSEIEPFHEGPILTLGGLSPKSSCNAEGVS